MDNHQERLNFFNKEMKMAIVSQKNGNNGRARVCARRAAGIVVLEFLQRHNLDNAELTAFGRIKLLVSLDQVPEDIRKIAAHFLLQVDKEFNLPNGIDLITDACYLAEALLGQTWFDT